ncbi:uncharacterized protein LOC594824 isoform X2 [Strongylocentrotus purpuratus]|uniref:C2H2-type domain-containing protein n=1 Tax=Strongylocentrotus purpuratus TaxID=7668 RepID=A0A7M7NMM3_STRPU|nr:uncharacterized protein LOC594824 isoform X2 [Strongylocentrotus purpuratus]
MSNASYNAEFQQTQSQSQPQARQTAQSFIPGGSATVSDVLDMLGYKMSTTLQERIDKSTKKISSLNDGAKMELDNLEKNSKREQLKKILEIPLPLRREKKSHKHHIPGETNNHHIPGERYRRKNELRKAEHARRNTLRKLANKLSGAIVEPDTSKASLKKRLGSALNCIKSLKFDSSMLLAERYWLILENRELSERLQVLRDGCGIHSIPRLWEDGLTIEHLHCAQWDEVTDVKSNHQMDVYEREKYFEHCLEDVRKQKMQLHEEYKSLDDAVRGKMEIGRWCTSWVCAAAPHKIHHEASLEGSVSLRTPPLSLEEEDRYEEGGWLEDTSKTELDHNKHPGKHSVTPDKSRTAPKRKTNDFPAGKEKKSEKRSKRKKGSGAKKKVKGVYILPKVPVDPKFIVTKDTGNSFSADGSNLFGGANGKLSKHDSVDPSLSNTKLIVIDLWNMQGETQKVVVPSSHSQVNLVLVPGSTSAQAPVTNVQPLVVPDSLETTDVDPSTGNGQVSFKLVPASPSARLSHPTVMKAKPQGALGSINASGLDPSKVPVASSVGHSQSKVMKAKPKGARGSINALGLDPVASSVGHSQPRVTKDQFRAAHGYPGVLGLEPSKVPVTSSVGHSQPTVKKDPFLAAHGSLGVLGLEPSKVPVTYSVGHSHPTMTKDQFLAAHGSLGVLGLDHSKVPVTSSVGQNQPMVMKDQFLATHGSLGVLGLDPSKVPEASSVGHSQPMVMKDQFLATHGSLGVLGLDPSKVPVTSSVGQNQPMVMKDQFRTTCGPLGMLGLAPSKGNGQADVMTVSAQAKVAQSKPEVTTSQQKAPGSVSLVKLDSKNVISERIKEVPVPTGDRVSQPTGTKDKYQVAGGSVSIGNLSFKIKKVTADVKALPAHQHGVELGKHTVIKVTHPFLSEFKVAPEHANVGHSQPFMTPGTHRVNPGSIGATAEAEADVTEEAERCGSPMSCMLCDKPFNNVKELQTHLIDSHSS